MTTWQSEIYGEGEPQPGDLAGGAYISTARITVLSIVSAGVYWIYWLYRTWKQYRDYTGKDAYPVWHGLTWFVPVYGFFRFHAHCREFKALMQERKIPDTLNLGVLTIVVVISTIMAFVAGSLISSAWVGLPIRLIALFVVLVDIIVSIVVMSHIQSNLNAYWASVDNQLMRSARFGKGEVLCILLGIILWLGTIAGIIWPS